MNSKERTGADAFEDRDFATSRGDEFEEQREGRLEDLKRENKNLAQENKEYRENWDIDALTGLPRRETFEKEFARETKMIEASPEGIDRRKHSEAPSTLLVADIDDFKKINDTYGHVIGDLVLKSTAKFLRDLLRDEDFVARVGGEEFYAILKNVTPEDFLKRLREIEGEAGKQRPTNQGSLHFEVEIPSLNEHEFPDKISVTLSGGLQPIPKGSKQEESIDRADTLLYKAKGLGKNIVISGETNLTEEAEEEQI